MDKLTGDSEADAERKWSIVGPELYAVLSEIERTVPMLTDEAFQMFGNGIYARMKAALRRAEGRE